RADIDVEDVVEIGRTNLVPHRRPVDPGIVDEDEDRAELAPDKLDEGRQPGEIGEVVDDCRPSEIRPLAIDADDLVAGLGEGAADRLADPAIAAGDEGDRALGILTHASSEAWRRRQDMALSEEPQGKRQRERRGNR